ncbi:MAG TPA: phospholipid carrier-dependent glycosyltransferase [Chloroflexi bacterium]|nr:phospholipid carrier-dependent glycosyltransferase [Chloroflexota bacterium]
MTNQPSPLSEAKTHHRRARKWERLPLPQRVELILFILILVLGAALRVVALDSAPPGLTHDEADHGMDAAGVLEGRRPIYFTVGYGREPLYDYVTAGVMLIVGRSYLASRLTAALFGTVLLILTYLWVRRATQNGGLALATMAGLAFSFWGISTSRQALRSVTLPVLYMAAAIAMRQGLRVEEDIEDDSLLGRLRARVRINRWWWFILAGAFLGLSFYTYLAARLMWAVFPAFFLFLSLTQPGVIRRAWPGLLVMLLVAALVAMPLGVYLLEHPEAEARIGQLSGPLEALLAGDIGPLRQNVRAGLGMITIRGDDLWLYNIPGKPLLGPVMSLLFYLGVSVAVLSLIGPYRPAHRGRRTYDEAFRISSSNAFMLLTLAVGIVPALITGVGASNTRVIGMQPALYYFPALAVVWMADWARQQVGRRGETAIWAAYGVMILIVGARAINDYFAVWNNARDVRVAYHTTLVETLRYLDEHPEIGPDVGLSTITPGRFHDPAVARMRLERDDLRIRWFDGRAALVYPAAQESVLFFPEVAPPDPAFEGELRRLGQPFDRIELRPYDFNRTVDVIVWRGYGPEFSPEEAGQAVFFGDLLSLVDVLVLPDGEVHAGDGVEIRTTWHIEQATDEEIVIFSQALDDASRVVGQQDLLSVPAWDWFPGDAFVQVHRFTIPADTPPGTLRLSVGVYTRPDIVRLPVYDDDGTPLGDHLIVGTIEVVAP